eukprot:m.351225 g.351225  ORF g.351225 m.351225 type:complete len:91 (+) comp16200_c0_seq1:531-803(+)
MVPCVAKPSATFSHKKIKKRVTHVPNSNVSIYNATRARSKDDAVVCTRQESSHSTQHAQTHKTNYRVQRYVIIWYDNDCILSRHFTPVRA